MGKVFGDGMVKEKNFSKVLVIWFQDVEQVEVGKTFCKNNIEKRQAKYYGNGRNFEWSFTKTVSHFMCIKDLRFNRLFKKKYQKWYTIDALGAIFAIFKYSHFDNF